MYIKHFIIFILFVSGVRSQNILMFKSANMLNINDIDRKASYVSEQCTNVADYVFCKDKKRIFMITTSFFNGSKLCDNVQKDKLLYSDVEFKDSIYIDLKELPVQNPSHLSLNPSDEKILILTKNKTYFLIDTRSLIIKPLQFPDNAEIIGWWSSDKIFYKDNEKFISYDINTHENETIYSLEELKFYSTYFYSIYEDNKNFIKTDSNSFVIKMSNNNIDESSSLFYFTKNKSFYSFPPGRRINRIYYKRTDHFDFVCDNDGSVFLLEHENNNGDSLIYYLSKINFENLYKKRININNMFKISHDLSFVKLSNEIINNNVIISVSDITTSKFGFYKIDLKDYSYKVIYDKPVAMVEKINYYEY